MTSTPWRCETCGTEHQGLATVFGPQAPEPWLVASEEIRSQGELNADMCVMRLDGATHYFLRGQLELPVRDAEIGPFVWSVWVSLSPESMQTTIDHWTDPDRASLDPMFGWVCNELGVYDAPTMPMATHVHTRPPGVAPFIEVDPTIDHPLAREQSEGITLHRVAELNQRLLGG